MKKNTKQMGKTNWPVTILLIMGCVTIFFPLYMAVIIAFKKPSEMTNDIAGALSFPSSWSFDNFTEAMRVTDFWNSLGNSLLITALTVVIAILLTALTVVIAILLHSLAGYAIGRNMGKSKFYKFAYLYIVSGMFVPFAILMMPLVKQTSQMGIGNRAGVIILYVVFYMPMNLLLYSGYLKNIPLALEEAAKVKQTSQMGIGNRAGVIILYVVFYMPMNLLLYSGYLKNIPLALEEAAKVDGASTWKTYWSIIFPVMKPMHATVAVLTALGTWNDVMTPLVLGTWNDVMTPLVIMSGTGKNTLPLAQLNFQTQFGTKSCPVLEKILFRWHS